MHNKLLVKGFTAGVAALLSLSMAGGFTTAFAETPSDLKTSVTETSTVSQAQVNQMAEEMVKKAKETDAEGVAQRVKKLRTSDALMELLIPAGSETTDKYLEFFASISTDQQVDTFLKNSAGKRFVVPENATLETPVKIVDASTADNTKNTYSMPRCAKAWAAAAGYFAATEMICIPTAAMSGGVGGVVCNGIFFAAGMLPDFNAQC